MVTTAMRSTAGGGNDVPEFAEVTCDERAMRIHFADGATARFNRFWLRDNCPSNGDRASLFRPFTVASMSDDLTIVDAQLCAVGVRVTFSDHTVDEFPATFLREHAVTDETTLTASSRPAVGVVEAPTAITFDPDLAGSDGHHDLLAAICRDGVAFVTGVPAHHGTETIASWLGPIRETDFGRVFDIVSEPDPFTPSQSTSALDPHTDDPYRYTPAGISVLHCVTPCSGVGGMTTIVDGFAIADEISSVDADAFRLLSTVPVPYVHRRDASVEQGAAVHLRAAGPVISTDATGSVCGIRFHERSMAPLRLAADEADAFYRALMLFSRHVNGDRFCVRRRLAAGEAVVYDNQRVLHGRSAITGVEGRRHLRLCTVDRDQVHSRYRQLCERYAPGTECRPLPAGSGS